MLEEPDPSTSRDGGFRVQTSGAYGLGFRGYAPVKGTPKP